MDNFAEGPEIPMGLGMAMAQNLNAMNYFAGLSLAEQKTIIEHTHQIQSSDEMRNYVSGFAKDMNMK